MTRTLKRSAAYWRAFVGHAELEAFDLKRNRRVYHVGRGPYLIDLARKMVTAGIWEDVRVRRTHHKVWIPLEQVPMN